MTCGRAADKTLSLTFSCSVFFCFESSHVRKFVLGMNKAVEETDFCCHKLTSGNFSPRMSRPAARSRSSSAGCVSRVCTRLLLGVALAATRTGSV